MHVKFTNQNLAGAASRVVFVVVRGVSVEMALLGGTVYVRSPEVKLGPKDRAAVIQEALRLFAKDTARPIV